MKRTLLPAMEVELNTIPEMKLTSPGPFMFTMKIASVMMILEVTINFVDPPELDDPDPVIGGCGSAILPAIEGDNLTGDEAYYTGPNGTGIRYDIGDEIFVKGNLFIYDGAGTDCEDEVEMEVDFEDPPNITDPVFIEGCRSIELPEINGSNLTGSEAFYTQPNGAGNVYSPGETLDFNDDLILYVYDGEPGCEDEIEFEISHIKTPVLEEPDIDRFYCSGFILPANRRREFDWK